MVFCFSDRSVNVIEPLETKASNCDSGLSLSFSSEDSNSSLKCVAKMKLRNIEQITQTMRLLTFKVEEQVSFLAGQFIGVHPQDVSRESKEHEFFSGTFSIASCPSVLPLVQFAVSQDQNPRSMRHLMYFKLKRGDSLFVDRRGWGTVAVAPRMLMTPIGGPGGLCLISGGTALIGQLSIIDEMLTNPEGKLLPNVTIIHSNRSATEIPFHDKLRKLAEDSKITYILRITGLEPCTNGEPKYSQRGRVDLDLLSEVVPGKRLFCVCGSGPMVEGIVNMLLQVGVWPGSIRTDYTARVDPAKKLKKNLLNETKIDNSQPKVANQGVPIGLEGENGDLKARGRMSFAETPDGTQGESNQAEDFHVYFTKTGMRQFFEQNMKTFKSEKPTRPFQFWINQLNLHLETFPEVQNENAKDPHFWINYWETDSAKWHSPVVSPWLKHFSGKFLGQAKSQRILVPLCGKSADMLWLHSLGHSVVGCDCSGIALQDFFTMNHKSGGYTRNVIQIGQKQISEHTSKDMPNLSLFEGDFFDLTPVLIGGKVDCVLDRAALVALHPSMAERYLRHLLTLLKQSDNSKVLFASVSHLPFPVAPPHTWKAEQIEPILIKFFHEVTLLTTHKYRVNAGEVHEPIYLLQRPKTATE